MPTCFLVVGVPRGGTSLTAGILHHLGIKMGNEFMPTDEWNPKGTFADTEFEGFCDQVYEDEIWPIKKTALTDDEFKKLAELVSVREAEGQDWGLKCTRAMCFVEELKRLTNVVAVVVQRDPERSLASWIERADADPELSRQLIYGAANSVKNFIETANIPMTIVDFDEIIDSPVEKVGQIAARIGREGSKKAEEFPDASLRRF